MVTVLKKKLNPIINPPRLELVVDNVADSLMNDGLVEVFKDQNGSLVDEGQWFVNGELDGSMNYKGSKQKIRYSIGKIKNLFQKEENGFTEYEEAWFKEGNDPNYIALFS